MCKIKTMKQKIKETVYFGRPLNQLTKHELRCAVVFLLENTDEKIKTLSKRYPKICKKSSAPSPVRGHETGQDSGSNQGL